MSISPELVGIAIVFLIIAGGIMWISDQLDGNEKEIEQYVVTTDKRFPDKFIGLFEGYASRGAHPPDGFWVLNFSEPITKTTNARSNVEYNFDWFYFDTDLDAPYKCDELVMDESLEFFNDSQCFDSSMNERIYPLIKDGKFTFEKTSHGFKKINISLQFIDADHLPRHVSEINVINQMNNYLINEFIYFTNGKSDVFGWSSAKINNFSWIEYDESKYVEKSHIVATIKTSVDKKYSFELDTYP